MRRITLCLLCMASLASIWWLLSSGPSSQKYWEAIEGIGAAIVIAAAIGETLAELGRIPKDRKRRRRIVRISAVALIVGLMIELKGLFRVSDISDANLEAERMARVQLEAIVDWRKVDRAQWVKIKKELSLIKNEFSGMHVEVRSVSDPEATAYAIDLLFVMQEAGLDVDDIRKGITKVDLPWPVGGVWVGFNKSKKGAESAPRHLREILESAGVIVSDGKMDLTDQEGPIRVYVGYKEIPPDTQGVWKLR
jgi:hypothetical protein